jgi:hypothetical protein
MGHALKRLSSFRILEDRGFLDEFNTYGLSSAYAHMTVRHSYSKGKVVPVLN